MDWEVDPPFEVVRSIVGKQRLSTSQQLPSVWGFPPIGAGTEPGSNGRALAEGTPPVDSSTRNPCGFRTMWRRGDLVAALGAVIAIIRRTCRVFRGKTTPTAQ